MIKIIIIAILTTLLSMAKFSPSLPRKISTVNMIFVKLGNHVFMTLICPAIHHVNSRYGLKNRIVCSAHATIEGTLLLYRLIVQINCLVQLFL